ncbi:2,5-didehydrogluconate reductase DkgB [Halomonas faecis]|uniref:2,5-didehydrogluconate reductase DkgB n=1 Tax=Halomonas faecis TaxID=1562110 RepID=UPI0013D170CA|nr:2,5-didehydrogluconate reductase DkgB [Halomonas faecis]
MTRIPNPGFGTFRLEGDVLENAVKSALAAGYRHIDTAQMYGNETEVGEAIRESGIPRDEIFLTTKVWHDRLRPGDLEASVDESLDRLGTEYVDLLLIHWPSPDGEVQMDDYLNALKAVQDAGRAKHIGISNFTRAQVDQAIGILGEGTLLTNQIEVHPFLQNRALVEHCQSRGLEVTAYMPLAVGKVMKDTTLERIAQAHDANPAQVALAWIKARGLVTIPSSTKAEHIRSNLAAFEIALSDDEMAQIAELDCGERIANPDFAPAWD